VSTGVSRPVLIRQDQRKGESIMLQVMYEKNDNTTAIDFAENGTIIEDFLLQHNGKQIIWYSEYPSIDPSPNWRESI
jgi:hypothetical protein